MKTKLKKGQSLIGEVLSKNFIKDRKCKLNVKADIVTDYNDIKETGGNEWYSGIDSDLLHGLPVKLYDTQLTIHTKIKNEPENGRIGTYKLLALNKNESLGVKYRAIDYNKKTVIFTSLKDCRGITASDCSSYYYNLYNWFETEAEALAELKIFKAIQDKINTDLFDGKVVAYAYKDCYGRCHAVLNILIYAIKQSNVNKAIENLKLALPKRG